MNIFIPDGGLNINTRCHSLGAHEHIKGNLSELNTGDSVFCVHTSIDGTRIAEYHTNLIHLLDKVFLTNCLNIVSPEQERFLKRFFNQAGKADRLVSEEAENIYQDMDEIMQQLDNFLGSYYGVNDGGYA